MSEHEDKPVAGEESSPPPPRGVRSRLRRFFLRHLPLAVASIAVLLMVLAISLYLSLIHILPERHLFIGLVIQMQGPAPACVVTHNAVENHHRAVFAALGSSNSTFRVDTIAGQRNKDAFVFATLVQSVRCARSTAGDRWQQAHLVAVVQDVRGLGVLGIHAHRDAAQDFSRSTRGQGVAQALQQHGH